VRDGGGLSEKGEGGGGVAGRVEGAAALEEVADAGAAEGRVAGTRAEGVPDAVERGVGGGEIVLEALAAGDLGEEFEEVGGVIRGLGPGEKGAKFGFCAGRVGVVPEGVEGGERRVGHGRGSA
jgi:hypothetical protein